MTTKIEVRVGVAASQARVWELLADLEGWSAWNPTMRDLQGKLGIGAPLTFVQNLPGKAPETIQARVNDWIPYEQIHIGREMARGWAQSVRFIELEPLGPESCILSIGELFGGFLGDHIAKKERKALKAGFEAMGEAVREEAVKAPAADPGAAPEAPDPAAKIDEDVPPPAAGGRKKKSPALKPPVLNQYAPKPFGMKPPGGMTK